MNLRCLLLRHRPLLSSIIVTEERFSALCDRCGAPLERDNQRRWVTAPPLLYRRDPTA